jgi:site-specific DNA-methyltransferase (adenine-specific)
MELKPNAFLRCDFSDGLALIGNGSCDMILCDPPQGITKNAWDEPVPADILVEELSRVVKKNGAIVIFSNGMYTAKLMIAGGKLWRYNLVWEKTSPAGFLNANRMPLRAHEDICVFYGALPEYRPQKTTGHARKTALAEHKRNCRTGTNYGRHGNVSYDSTERYPRSVLRFPSDKQKSCIHPTQKPVALCEFLIRSYTDEGDIVLDPFAGSGTTPVAAIRTGRRYLAFERDRAIYGAAAERIAAETSALSENG